MRDLQRLEELSSTAALGLWADDVVLALDRALRQQTDESDRRLLADAAELLEKALERTAQPLVTPKSARDLAATDTALSALAALMHQGPGDERELLADMASVIREAADGKLRSVDAERLHPVMALFELVGEHQLVASSSVLNARKDSELWTATQTTSSSS